MIFKERAKHICSFWKIFAGLGMLGFFGVVGAAHAEVVRTGYTTLVSANSGKCLGISGASSAATRPVISQAPTTASVGGSLSVKTAAPIVSFVLMRLSSNTHSVNNDQRRIPLLQTPYNGGTSYTLTIPSNTGTVLPGYYWLFAINDQGVPSVGSTILID